jgi:DNA-binding transcriptional LysR family regulator
VYDLHRLRLLREVHLRGTLAAVAEALGYSPSSISHQLAILEREVGVPLLEPQGRRVRLTSAAEILVSHTTDMLLRLERAEAAMTAFTEDVRGTLRMATFQTAAHTLIPDMVARLASKHPGLMVTVAHIHAHAAIPALQARDYDLVLYEQYPGNPVAPHSDVATEILAADPLNILVPATSAATALPDLASARWVAEPFGTPARTWMTSVCHAAGFDPTIVFESPDVLLHARLVSKGHAVALIPQLAFVPSPSTQTLPTGEHRIIATAIRRGSEENRAITAARNALQTAAE